MTSPLPTSLATHLDRLSQERPCVSEAIKTLLAQELAKAKVELRGVFGAPEGKGHEESLRVAGMFLRTVNSMTLAVPEEWINANPQGDNQTGMARMDEIIMYRAAFALWKKTKDTQNKPSMLLGRSFLVVIWSQLSKHMEFNMAGMQQQQPHQVIVARGFVDAVHESLLLDDPLNNLVWAVSVENVLVHRHNQRVQDAKQRLEDRKAEEEEEEEEELRRKQDGGPSALDGGDDNALRDHD